MAAVARGRAARGCGGAGQRGRDEAGGRAEETAPEPWEEPCRPALLGGAPAAREGALAAGEFWRELRSPEPGSGLGWYSRAFFSH